MISLSGIACKNHEHKKIKIVESGTTNFRYSTIEIPPCVWLNSVSRKLPVYRLLYHIILRSLTNSLTRLKADKNVISKENSPKHLSVREGRLSSYIEIQFKDRMSQIYMKLQIFGFL